MTQQTIAQISKLSADQLDELAESLLDFEGFEDLERWLAIDR